jgi:hypothetical protein
LSRLSSEIISYNEFSLAQLIYAMGVGAVEALPISLMFSLFFVAITEGDQSKKGGDHDWGPFSNGDRTLADEWFERCERERRIDELRKWENERYQDP